MSGVQSTAGHLAGNGGLRGHSVGGVFPCVMVAKGNPHNNVLKYYFISPDSREHGPYPSWDDAEDGAKAWLNVHRPVSFEPQKEM